MHRQRNGNDGKHREHHRIGLRKDFFLFPNPDTETVVVGRSLGVFVSRWNNNDTVHTQGRKQMTSLMQTNIQRSRRRQRACVRACRPLTSSIAVTEVRKPPHVSQTHAVSDTGEQELVLPAPLLPGFNRRGQCNNWRLRVKLRLWSRGWCGGVAVLGDGVIVEMHRVLDGKIDEKWSNKQNRRRTKEVGQRFEKTRTIRDKKKVTGLKAGFKIG